jgi:hypothetical protein
LAAGFLGVDYKNKVIIDGGPMMGNITDPNSPITKITGGLLIFSKQHPAVKLKSHVWNIFLRWQELHVFNADTAQSSAHAIFWGMTFSPVKSCLQWDLGLQQLFKAGSSLL